MLRLVRECVGLGVCMSKVVKPWGSYTDFIREDNVVLKEIIVSPGKRLSLQTHQKREEYWIVLFGSGLAVLDNLQTSLFKGSVVHVKIGQKHRIINNSDSVLRIAEVQLGECIETDVVRYEDDFGREGTNY